MDSTFFQTCETEGVGFQPAFLEMDQGRWPRFNLNAVEADPPNGTGQKEGYDESVKFLISSGQGQEDPGDIQKELRRALKAHIASGPGLFSGF